MIFLRNVNFLSDHPCHGHRFARNTTSRIRSPKSAMTHLPKWMQIISGFALVLGLAQPVPVHAVKIRRKVPGWGYSVVLYLGMLGTIAVGLFLSKGRPVDGAQTAFGWIYNYTMVPLQGTMFAILAFFIASAAYRSFRARSREAAVLLVAAVIVMTGRVPLGEFLLPWTLRCHPVDPERPERAVRRAILIGVSLGTVALSLKIIFGMNGRIWGEGKEQ